MQKRVSVIVPVYNVAKYVEKCLDSLVAQSYQEIEIIIVNDGSTDESEAIIKEKYSSDSRVKYYFQSNSGLGAARNTGIKHSTGSYLMFVDSDDWIRNDAVELIMQCINEDKSEAAIFNMDYIFPDGRSSEHIPIIRNRECISNIEGIRNELIGEKYKFHAPNKVFSRSLFVNNGILFPEGKLYEDLATTYKLLSNAKRISLIPEKLYFYLQKRSGSITGSKINERMYSDLFEAIDGAINFVEDNGWDMKYEVQALYVENVISICNYLYWEQESIRNYYHSKLVQENNWSLMRNVLNNKCLSSSKKIRGYMIYRHWPLYCMIMKVIRGVKG